MQGIRAGKNRIAHIMRRNRWRGVSKRRSYVVTTRRDEKQRPAPDLVDRQFVADVPNQLWVADMTYVPTWQGFIFLAIVLDRSSASGIAHLSLSIIILCAFWMLLYWLQSDGLE